MDITHYFSEGPNVLLDKPEGPLSYDVARAHAEVKGWRVVKHVYSLTTVEVIDDFVDYGMDIT